MSEEWRSLYNGATERRFFFRPPDPPSNMRTENWEADNPPHIGFVRLECSCRDTHRDHQRAIDDALRLLASK